jgi:hypothetical protein
LILCQLSFWNTTSNNGCNGVNYDNPVESGKLFSTETPLQEVFEMMNVKTPWYPAGLMALLLFGIPVSGIGIAVFFITDRNPAFLLVGGIFMLLGALSIVKGASLNRKLNRFKSNSKFFDATVTTIISANFLRIGSFITARVECSYKNGNDKKCLVRSGYYLLTGLDRMEDLYAKVHLGSDNPKDYIVELFRKSAKTPNVDLDYR